MEGEAASGACIAWHSCAGASRLSNLGPKADGWRPCTSATIRAENGVCPWRRSESGAGGLCARAAACLLSTVRARAGCATAVSAACACGKLVVAKAFVIVNGPLFGVGLGRGCQNNGDFFADGFGGLVGVNPSAVKLAVVVGGETGNVMSVSVFIWSNRGKWLRIGVSGSGSCSNRRRNRNAGSGASAFCAGTGRAAFAACFECIRS